MRHMCIFYDHWGYITVIWYILLALGNLGVIWYNLPPVLVYYFTKNLATLMLGSSCGLRECQIWPNSCVKGTDATCCTYTPSPRFLT
jgi:hypothetical protein